MIIMNNIFVKYLTQKNKEYIKSLIHRVNLGIVAIFAISPFMSTIYYLLISREFDREHHSVLNARLKYEEKLYNINSSSVLLRRNIHRLEKGIIMRPRKSVFADAYIEETVDCYFRCVDSNKICLNEIKWATDVLTEYFSIVGKNSVIERMRLIFYKRKTQSSMEPGGLFIPYKKSSIPKSAIKFEQLEKLFKQRRSIRWYLKKKVSIEIINKAVSIATLAPSACNRQPFEFYVVNDSNKASEIADCAMGTAGFSDNIQSIIVVIGDLSAYPSERDRHVIYIDASLAAMQLMLTFETLGLSSCPINWPDIEMREKKLGDLLGLSYFQRPIMMISVGYADPEGMVPYSQKKTSEFIVKEVVL